jgi:hypothetical protein
MAYRLATRVVPFAGRVQERVNGQQQAFAIMDCAECGMLFGLTAEFSDRRREDGESWYCPNGHLQFYGATDLDRERAARERAESELTYARQQRDRARADADHARHVAAGHKAYATRIRNRIANGVCPWCNRSFENVRRHVATVHPDHTDELEA